MFISWYIVIPVYRYNPTYKQCACCLCLTQKCLLIATESNCALRLTASSPHTLCGLKNQGRTLLPQKYVWGAGSASALFTSCNGETEGCGRGAWSQISTAAPPQSTTKKKHAELLGIQCLMMYISTTHSKPSYIFTVLFCAARLHPQVKPPHCTVFSTGQEGIWVIWHRHYL